MIRTSGAAMHPCSPLRTCGILFLAILAGGLGAAPAAAAELSAVAGAVTEVTGADQAVVAVRLTLSGSQPTASAFRASNPERLVIDMSGVSLAAGASVAPGGLVRRGEFSTFDDGAENVRLTLFLDGAANHELRVEGDTIVITLSRGAAVDPLASALGGAPGTAVGTPSGPTQGVMGPALATLDLQQRQDSTRVVLGLQDVEPAVSQPEPDLVAIDLPGAALPSSLGRELNAEHFFSAIRSVRARSTRSGARVEVRLRAAAEYSVQRDGLDYILDFKTPPEILAQRDALIMAAPVAAPATPETTIPTPGLGNAVGNELLIGASGRTYDPATTFGAGAGASEPDALSFAEEAPGTANARYIGRRMSVDLQDADIHTVFRFIADTAELNIVASDDVKGKVTVRLKDVPWDQALASILQSKGLGAQRFGNIVRVAPIETIKAEQQAALEAKRARELLEPLQVYVAPLNYASADALVASVKPVLSERGAVQVDKVGNQLMIKDVGASIAQVRELLKALDHQNRQVTIDSRFVEATSTFRRDLGIQWGSSVDASARTGYPTGAFFPDDVGVAGGLSRDGLPQFYTPGADSLLVDLGPANASSGISFSLGSIPGLVDLDARLAALESEGWGRVVSSPNVRTLDNTPARVKQGARVPFLSVSQGGTQVQFINAALEMEVTPHITADGMVKLEVQIKNNRPDFSLAVQGQPTIQIKEVDSQVIVADGDTAVLGGVYATSDSWSQSRVPGLGNIPLLGYLFKNSSRQKSQAEMLVFITPRIVPETEG